MSKVRDLPQTTTLADDDLLYAVDYAAGPNGGRKIRKADLKTAVAPTAAETKTAYESNPNTNAFTDAEKAKLATVQANAAFQNASQVPYSNTSSGLPGTNVQDAIDEVNIKAQADFLPLVVANRILSYSGGTARFDGVFYSILPSDILLTANITDGYVYLDLDGTVKQTGSGVLPPPYTIVFAKFSTNANNITALEDQRVKNAQNIIRGLVTDIEDVNAGDTAYEGDTGRIADAGHRHAVLTGVVSTQTPDQVNAEGTSVNLARADHIHQLVTAAPTTTLSPATTNAQGVATSFARSDHTHAISTALVSDITTILPDATASAGTANTFARGDHRHAIVADVAVDVGAANTEGSSTSFSRADHVHRGVRSVKANAGSQRFNDLSLVSGTGATVTDDGSGNFTIETVLGGNELFVTQGAGLVANYTAGRVRINGTSYSIAASSISVATGATNGRIYVDIDGTVKSTTATSTPPNAVPLAIYSSSGAAITALSDNRTVLNVALQFGASGDIANLNATNVAAAGATNKYADAGHVHTISTGTPSTQTPDQVNATGTSANLARADHIHQLVTAAPLTTLSPATTNTQGTATSFARSDHTHAIATALVTDITTIQPDATASAGTANTYARGDHRHAIVADPAVSISTSTTNTEGVSTSFARADHTHAVSVSNQEATATADDTVVSLTDVLMNSMTQTPAAGTYFVMWTGSIVNSANGAERTWVSLYLNGVQVSATERSIGTAGGAYEPTTTHAIITTPGAQAIELRWRVAGGTSTVHSRRLTLIKLS